MMIPPASLLEEGSSEEANTAVDPGSHLRDALGDPSDDMVSPLVECTAKNPFVNILSTQQQICYLLYKLLLIDSLVMCITYTH